MDYQNTPLAPPPIQPRHRSLRPLYLIIGLLFPFVIFLALVFLINKVGLLSIYRTAELTGSSIRNMNTQPASDWKEYKSPTFGYSIRYPKEFLAAGDELDGALYLSPTSPLLKEFMIGVKIETHDKYKASEQSRYPNPVNIGELTLDGKSAEKMESVIWEGTPHSIYTIHYVVKDGGSAYSIDCSSSTKNLLDANKSLCLAIASTFRKVSSLSPTPQAKHEDQPEEYTYIDKACGYAFNYQSNWRISSLGNREVNVEIPSNARTTPGNDMEVRISCNGFVGPKKNLDAEVAECLESKQMDEAKNAASVYVCKKVSFDNAEFVQYATKAFNIDQETAGILINIGNDTPDIPPDAYRILNSFKLITPSL